MIDREIYKQRILTANPIELVVINLELCIEFLKESMVCHCEELATEQSMEVEGTANTGLLRTGEKVNFFPIARNDGECRFSLTKAIDSLQELIKSLDFQVSLSHEFYEIYKYINRLLNKALSSNDQDALKEALGLFEILIEGWKKLEEESKDMKSTNNMPKIYAGLTYGRDGSANEYIEESSGGYIV